MSGGLGGTLTSVSDMASGIVQSAGTGAGMIGTAISGNPAVGAAIGAIGSLAATAIDAMMKPAVQAYMINLETGIKSGIFNASVGKLGGYGGGLKSSSGISLLRSDMSMDEVEGVKNSGMGAGISFGTENKNARNEFEQLAASTKLWGESSVNVMRTVAYATGDYKTALAGLNSIMVSSREGAKNMNISVEDTAQQMASAGLSARLMGTDTDSAMGVYRAMVSTKS